MSNKVIANLSKTIGLPFKLACNQALAGLDDKLPFRFILATAGIIITLPLLPFSIYGLIETSKLDEENFWQKNNHLPKISLPLWNEDGYNLIAGIYEEKGEWWVEPFCHQSLDDQEEYFYSEEEARNFLSSLGYIEVLDKNLENHFIHGTKWIKASLFERLRNKNDI